MSFAVRSDERIARLAKLPFVARKEHFGCLVYDRSNADYIPFDGEATSIFEKSLTQSPDEIHRDLMETVSRQSFDTFLQLCASIGLIKDGTFQGAFSLGEVTEGVKHLSAPTLVHLQLTKFCNMSCKHCWIDAGTPRANELTLPELCKLFDEMALLGVFKLRLGGGEPLGREDWFEVIQAANLRGIRVSLSTNATLATRAVATKLAECNLEEIKVSMDGGNEKSYDFLRCEAAYRRATRGLKNLTEMVKAPIYLHAVLQRDNLTDIPALIKQAERFEIKRMVFDVVSPVGRARENSRVLLTTEEANNAVELVKRVSDSSRIQVDIPAQIPPPYNRKRVYEGFGSEAGQLHCYVQSDGVVAASGFMASGLPAGSLREMSLKEIWETGHGFRVLRGNPGNHICRKCSHFKACRGGDRARAYVSSGSVTEPDPMCLLAKQASAPR
jgi:radical SAM protein with 4Fe4S-binding SPASM domain